MKCKQQKVAWLKFAMRTAFIQTVLIVGLVMSLFANKANSQAVLEKTFTISARNEQLVAMIATIQQQTKVKFSFSNNLQVLEKQMSYSAENKKISDFLREIIAPLNIGYNVIDEQIILYSLTDNAAAVAKAAIVAEDPLKGIILNEKGDPMEGVSIKVKGKNKGVQTSFDGSFTIPNVANGTILVISYIGYQSEEYKVEANKPFQLSLKLSTSKLDDVVVVGYGTSTRRQSVGSYSTLKGEAIADMPVQSFEGALNGRATGVNMIANSGVVNQAPVFRIRGINSLTLSSYPLIVVDGVPVYVEDINVGGNASNNPLAFLNPADIESIDIAKDASATSIYGSRAANGVVFVTTKKGKTGKPKFVYDVSVSSSEATRLAAILDADQYLEIKNEGLVNAGTYNATTNFYGTSVGPDGNIVRTNWYDYIFRTGMSQNHTISLSGSNQTTKYYFSLGYTKQEGILKGNDFGRKSVTYNIDHKVNSWLTVGSKTNYSNNITTAVLSTGNGVSSSASNSVAYRLALVAAPIIGPYNKDGSFNATGLNLGLMDNQGHLTSTTRMGYTNPVITLNYNDDNTSNNIIQSNIYAQINPTSWITFKTLYGIDNIYSRTNRYFDPRTNEGVSSNGSSTGISAKRESFSWTNTLTLDRTFNKHSTNLLLGQEVQNKTGDQFGLNRTNQSDPFYSNLQGGFGTVVISNTSNQVYYKYFNSLFSRLQYNFDKKYFLTASLRKDQTSLLGKNNKSGMFWSAAGAWELSNEEFWKNSAVSKIFETVRLRASYGKVGNIAGIGDYATLSSYSANLYGGLPGLFYSASGNEDLKWETSKKTDIGLYLSMLHGRLTADVSYYKNNIDGLIFGVPTPASAGLPGSPQNSVLSNVGSMYNKGVEIGLNGTPVITKNFTWSTGMNFSFNDNKVTALSPDVSSLLINGLGGSTDLVSISLPGYSVGMIYAIRTDGVDAASGRRVFLDKSGKKVLYQQVPAAGKFQWEYEDGTKAPAVTTTNDGVVYKNTAAKIYGGFNNTLRYKNLEMDLLFTYQFGGFMYYGTQGTLMDNRFANNSTLILNRWQKPGDITDVPRVQDGDFTSWGYSLPITANVYSSDYVRLKNITFSYNLPDKYLKKLQLSNLKFYVSGQNLALITSYPGSDPEVTTTDNATATQGFDRNMTPNAKTITVGLKINF